MKLNILKYICVALPLAGLTACLDFDTPSDEFADNEIVLDPIVYKGNADKIDFTKEITEEGFAEAEKALKTQFGMFETAQYYACGGKDGNPPQEHAYQYAYSLTTDNYAGYLTICSGTAAGDYIHTYLYIPKYCDAQFGVFNEVKKTLVNMLNINYIDSIVEMKAVGLLLYDLVAQEMTDIYGSIPYVDYKNNKETNPFEFNKGFDIYASIVSNLDDIVACFDNFKNRPDWYKKKVNRILSSYDVLTIDKDLESWRRLANSLKLRMAMHVVKVRPDYAKQWAEEAVASGVIENDNQQIGCNRASGWFGAHPLKVIMDWDSRLNASFESLLFSLDHPYTKYFLAKNNDQIRNTVTKEVTPANDRVIGLRAGISMISSQLATANFRYAYSKFEENVLISCPVYLFKWAEVDFLRAEGCLRGWNMGGSLEQFYERGIRNATAENIYLGGNPKYNDYVEDYLKIEQAKDYTYVDPADNAYNHESVTKIGVKLLGSDSPETKLEKIITQKYIALFPNSMEAWGEMRRTGYPKIFPVINPNISNMGLSEGDLIRRIPLPGRTNMAGLDDINATGIEALGGPDNMATRVFWDVEGPNL